jgi:transcriptional regulator with XRE-family HTH domain
MNALALRSEARSWNQVPRADDRSGWQWLADLKRDCVLYAQSRRVALQSDAANDSSQYDADVLHDVPASRPQHGVEQHPMYLPSDNRTLGERIARALGRRIGYGITRKQLQHALNVSSGTVDNLLSGHQDPSPRVFMALLQFFDAAFAHEILAPSGFTVVKLSDVRAAEAVERYIQSVQALKALEQVRGE